MALDYFSLGHPLVRVRSHFALGARRRMFERFMDEMRPSSGCRILDLGVTPDSSLPESNFFEKLYPYPQQITACSIEDASFLEWEFPGMRFVQVGKGKLPFADDEFDVLFCSAVLEHVGTREDQSFFLSEIARVSRRAFLTTPNRWFPVDFHTMLPLIHWLPQRLHQRLLRLLGHDFLSRTENLNLLGRRDVLALLPDMAKARIHVNRLFGMASNLMVCIEK
ncbi:methyltransferase domain-containing protein [Pseudomonas nicosulfuronedens]